MLDTLEGVFFDMSSDVPRFKVRFYASDFEF